MVVVKKQNKTTINNKNKNNNKQWLKKICFILRMQWKKSYWNQFSGNSERHGWGGGSGWYSHWVQPQIQGWRLFKWRRALLLGFKLFLQLCVEFLQWFAALWSQGKTFNKISEHGIQNIAKKGILYHSYTYLLLKSSTEKQHFNKEIIKINNNCITFFSSQVYFSFCWRD